MEKIQPPVGAYDREGGVSLFSQGKLAVLLDEPSRVVPFEDEGLPFEWDIDLPVGAPGGGRTTSRPRATVSMHARSQQEGSGLGADQVHVDGRELEPSTTRGYAFVPARDDADASGGNPLLVKNQEFAQTAWDGLVTYPKISQVLEEYSKALEAACVGSSSVEDALNSAQTNAEAILAGE